MNDQEICPHYIIDAEVTSDLKFKAHCAACMKDMTDPETRAGQMYMYSQLYKGWVRLIPKTD